MNILTNNKWLQLLCMTMLFGFQLIGQDLEIPLDGEDIHITGDMESLYVN